MFVYVHVCMHVCVYMHKHAFIYFCVHVEARGQYLVIFLRISCYLPQSLYTYVFLKDKVSQWAWISLTLPDWDGGMGEGAESLRGVLVSAS